MMQNPGRHDTSSIDTDTLQVIRSRRKKLTVVRGPMGKPVRSRKRPQSCIQSVGNKLNHGGEDEHLEVLTETEEMFGHNRAHKKQRVHGRGELECSPQTVQVGDELPGTHVPNTALNTPQRGMPAKRGKVSLVVA